MVGFRLSSLEARIETPSNKVYGRFPQCTKGIITCWRLSQLPQQRAPFLPVGSI